MERMCLAGGTGVIQALSMYCDRVHFYHPISTSDQFLLNKLILLGSGYTPADTSIIVECGLIVRWGRLRTSVRTGRRGRDCLVPTPIQFRFVEICTVQILFHPIHCQVATDNNRDDPAIETGVGGGGALLREVRAIVTVYLATLLGGYSNGFSAIAIPDIKAEMVADNGSAYSDLIIPRLEAASEEQLSWFGEIMKLLISPLCIQRCCSQQCQPGPGGGLPPGGAPGWEVGAQEDDG